MKISAVINTYNEEKNIKKAIESVLWADEILVCDMYSQDQTVKIAGNLGAKIIYHKRTDYVEPARNFAIAQASYEWVFVMDADEQIPELLIEEIKKILNRDIVPDYIEIPRKNIIFNKWMKASMWWPDYNTRFFRKGKVVWSDKIHSQPEVHGQGIKLPVDEKMAIVHQNYQSIDQFIARMSRYTSIEAEFLKKEKYKFNWMDLISKPFGEFLSRYFANQGYKDGLHGLSLSLLQALSFFIVYLKVWEQENFKEYEIGISEIEGMNKKAGVTLKYWFVQSKLTDNPIKNILIKIKHKF